MSLPIDLPTGVLVLMLILDGVVFMTLSGLTGFVVARVIGLNGWIGFAVGAVFVGIGPAVLLLVGLARGTMDSLGRRPARGLSGLTGVVLCGLGVVGLAVALPLPILRLAGSYQEYGGEHAEALLDHPSLVMFTVLGVLLVVGALAGLLVRGGHRFALLLLPVAGVWAAVVITFGFLVMAADDLATEVETVVASQVDGTIAVGAGFWVLLAAVVLLTAGALTCVLTSMTVPPHLLGEASGAPAVPAPGRPARRGFRTPTTPAALPAAPATAPDPWGGAQTSAPPPAWLTQPQPGLPTGQTAGPAVDPWGSGPISSQPVSSQPVSSQPGSGRQGSSQPGSGQLGNDPWGRNPAGRS